VVDSDYRKAGRFVPRTAQEIRRPEYLLEHEVDIIIITTQWRAKDIFLEIADRRIPYETVMVLLNQELREYSGEDI
jgi:protein O-GlcNAc transferase